VGRGVGEGRSGPEIRLHDSQGPGHSEEVGPCQDQEDEAKVGPNPIWATQGYLVLEGWKGGDDVCSSPLLPLPDPSPLPQLRARRGKPHLPAPPALFCSGWESPTFSVVHISSARGRVGCAQCFPPADLPRSLSEPSPMTKWTIVPLGQLGKGEWAVPIWNLYGSDPHPR
jgi:hypothetical protein